MLTKVEHNSDGPAASDNFFPILNALYDVWMPQLKDTEFRMLCVIFRQTWGRKNPQTGRRKERDWLSQSQLKKRTGRGGDAVAAAIDSLAQRGLLIVEAEDGAPLRTSQARRRHLSRLFYRLGPTLLAREEGGSGKVGQPLGKAGDKADISGEAADIFGPDAPQSRVDKADTTKNKQDRSKETSSIGIFQNGVGAAKALESGMEKSLEEGLTQAQRESIEEIKKSIRERLRGIASVK